LNIDSNCHQIKQIKIPKNFTAATKTQRKKHVFTYLHMVTRKKRHKDVKSAWLQALKAKLIYGINNYFVGK